MINKSRSILLRRRNVSDKIFTGNRNTRFMFNNFFSQNRTVSQMWKKNTAHTW